MALGSQEDTGRRAACDGRSKLGCCHLDHEALTVGGDRQRLTSTRAVQQVLLVHAAGTALRRHVRALGLVAPQQRAVLDTLHAHDPMGGRAQAAAVLAWLPQSVWATRTRGMEGEQMGHIGISARVGEGRGGGVRVL